MTRFGSALDKLGKHPGIIAISGLVALTQATLWALQTFHAIPVLPFNSTIVTHSAVLTFGVSTYGVIRLVTENRNLKEVYPRIHDINHLYRETLAATSLRLLEVDKTDTRTINTILLETEEKTVERISQLIANIFRLLTRKECVVTVWLYESKSDACREYVCSHSRIEAARSLDDRTCFHVSANTIFSECKTKKGKCCHFFSADLEHTQKSNGGYDDDRKHFGELYQSVLTVPIRFSAKAGEDRLGYLQVDTKSRYKLNDTDHLYLLSAFADQLYNFLSLVRRNYFFS